MSQSDPTAQLAALARDGRLTPALIDALLAPGPVGVVAARLSRLRALIDPASIAEDETAFDLPETLVGASELARPRTVPLPDALPDTATAAAPTAAERYIPLDVLGRGGMGEVWRARDTLLDRDVALKRLRPKFARDASAWARFGHEARLTARLGHPGIIPVYDLGTTADGAHCYSMQLISGRTLGDLLKTLRADAEARAAYPLARLLPLFNRICLTVAFAHDRDVIHRDLKPSNVMLGAYGEVYVADWGLAQLVDEAGDTGDSYTRPGVPIGTPNYMSPEQVRGEAGRYGRATDIWSLGVMLYELTTFEKPFAADSPVATMYRVMEGPLPDARAAGVPEPIAALIERALVRDVDRRTLTAREMADHLSTFIEGVEAHRRRVARAAEMLQRAHATWAEHGTVRRALTAARSRLAEQRAAAARTHDADQRRATWAAEQRLVERTLEAEALAARALREAQASHEEHETAGAGALLAEMYWLRAEEARRRRDEATALFFRARVQQYDTGAYRDRLATEGRVHIEAPGARIRVDRETGFGPIFVAAAIGPPEAERCARTLAVGSYVAHVVAPGALPVRLPFTVEGNCDKRFRVDAPARFAGDEAFVYIAAGRYRIGGDVDAPRGLDGQTVSTDGFLIGRHPITLAEYVRFLDAMAADDPDRARRHAPRSMDGSRLYLDYDPQTRRFAVPGKDDDGDAWDPRWPALMLNWHDAVAYCRWRTAAEGVEHRLPTELEWELAARGADGRIFPWGNGFDETLCRMADTARGRPMPVPVGSHPHDCSPFGVYDMAGLVAEWTATLLPAEGDQAQQAIQRGGSFVSPPLWCRAGTRRSNYVDYVTHHFGFRVVRALA